MVSTIDSTVVHLERWLYMLFTELDYITYTYGSMLEHCYMNYIILYCITLNTPYTYVYNKKSL